MARIYADLCEKEVRNFYSVPASLQPQVRVIIERDGYVINDDGTVTKRIVPPNTETEEEVTNEEDITE